MDRKREQTVERLITDLAETTATSFIKLHQSMDKQFKDVHTEMDKRFNDVHTEMDKRFNDVHTEMDKRFNDVDGQLKELGINDAWMKEILEKHSGFLMRLDQERLFTVNRTYRLEEEVEHIKAQLNLK